MKTTVNCLIILVFISFTHPLYAGQLHDFEKRGTEKRESSKKSSSTRSNGSTDSDSGSSCIGSIVGLAFFGIAAGVSHGAKNSMVKTGSTIEDHQKKETAIKLREDGAALLPYVRFDYGYQNVINDIKANDYRLEFGKGAFGVQARHTDFVEKNPKDELGLTYFHGLLRLSFGDYIEIAPGIGKIKLDGDNSSNGFSFTLPVLVHPTKNVGFECRPVWSTINGNSIRDIDVSVLAGTDYASLKLGYRMIKTGDEELKGPYVGCSIRF